jgi:hypothetical protein
MRGALVAGLFDCDDFVRAQQCPPGKTTVPVFFPRTPIFSTLINARNAFFAVSR